jgi:hypothetical protein
MRACNTESPSATAEIRVFTHEVASVERAMREQELQPNLVICLRSDMLLRFNVGLLALPNAVQYCNVQHTGESSLGVEACSKTPVSSCYNLV